MIDKDEVLRLADECITGYPLGHDAINAGVRLRRLHAECDRLRSELDAALDVVIDLGGEVRTPEIDDARRMRADAERYRKLRDGQCWPATFASCDAPEPLRGMQLDAAIDAARKG